MWVGKRIFPVPSTPIPSNRWSPRSAWRLIPYTRPRPEPVGCGRTPRHPALAPVRSPAAFACDERLAPAPASPPAWPWIIDPRLFLLSRVRVFLKGFRLRPKIVGEDRPEHDVLPHSEDRSEGRSTDGGIAESRRRKTPLVLPCEGRDAQARGFTNLRERVLSLLGRDREGLVPSSS